MKPPLAQSRRDCAVKLIEDTEGATLIEYGLLAALVGLVCVAAMAVSGQNLQSLWQTIGSSIASVNAN